MKITLNGLTDPVTVRVDMTDDRGTKTIHEERHYPDDVFEVSAEGVGLQAVFKIYYDGELMDTQIKKAGEEGGTP